MRLTISFVFLDNAIEPIALPSPCQEKDQNGVKDMGKRIFIIKYKTQLFGSDIYEYSNSRPGFMDLEGMHVN